MSAFLNPFSLTAPAGTDPANNIDGYILDGVKKALDERFKLEHQSLNTGTNETTSATAQGRHIPGKVGCLYYGTYAGLVALTAPGNGAIGYATDTASFYFYLQGPGWGALSWNSSDIVPDNITLALTAGSPSVMGMKHDNQQWTTTFPLTDAATIVTDCDESNSFSVTLGGNRLLDFPSNQKTGATYIWIIKQDVAGSRTLVYDDAFLFPGGIAPVLTTDGGAVDIITGISAPGVVTNVIYCSVMYDVKATV